MTSKTLILKQLQGLMPSVTEDTVDEKVAEVQALSDALLFDEYLDEHSEQVQVAGLTLPDTPIRFFKGQGEMNSSLSGNARCVLEVGEPEIKLVTSFLTPEEVAYFNKVIDEDTGICRSEVEVKGKGATDDIRTSLTSWYAHKEGIPRDVKERIIAEVLDTTEAENAGWSIGFEEFQLAQYDFQQRYEAHLDEYHAVPNVNTRRVATCLIYLQEPDQGGETTFPLLGISCAPRAGDMVLFSYLTGNEMSVHRTLHQANALLAGRKRIITLWVFVYKDEK